MGSKWMNVDLLAETTMQSYSAFNYNPINFIDPDGRSGFSPIYGTERVIKTVISLNSTNIKHFFDLNLPSSITTTNGNISYIYDASGTKLQKTVTEGSSVASVTDYAGNYIYEDSSLKQITTSEGYIEPDDSGWQYVYRLTDIWGNTRITYADDNGDGDVGASEIRREQNYYPGGLEHTGYNSSMYGVKNNLKTYQGQEFTDDLGLNTHEWRYRISDPATLRFWQIDPLAENYVYNSTYAFQENKLGMGTELEGKELREWWNQAVAGWDKLVGQPLRSENKRQAVHVAVYGAPERKQPGKNITGNYLGDAALTLLGGDVVIDAFNGNQRAREQLVLSWPFFVIPEGRGAGDDVANKIIDDLPTLQFSKSETPNITNNIEKAINDGASNILTRETSKSQIRANRRAALKNMEGIRNPGQSLDEYPFASSKEGGKGARVQAVPIQEQNIQGGKMSQFYQKNDLNNGDKYKVEIKD